VRARIGRLGLAAAAATVLAAARAKLKI